MTGRHGLAAGGGRRRIPAFLRRVGPEVVAGAADDDPSGIAPCTQAGAQFGTVLLQVFVPCRRPALLLKWLTLRLFVDLAAAFTVEIRWAQVDATR